MKIQTPESAGCNSISGENPRENLSLACLARRVAMSERSLGRRFKEVTNIDLENVVNGKSVW